jgi:predicted RNase H-like nuclease (RuvC/YqgF family)
MTVEFGTRTNDLQKLKELSMLRLQTIMRHEREIDRLRAEIAALKDSNEGIAKARDYWRDRAFEAHQRMTPVMQREKRFERLLDSLKRAVSLGYLGEGTSGREIKLELKNLGVEL